VVAINELSTARTECVPVFECRCVSWVPALKARAGPNAIHPLGTRDNAKGTIVTLSMPWYHRKSGDTRFGLAFLADNQEVCRDGDIEGTLRARNSTQPEIRVFYRLLLLGRLP